MEKVIGITGHRGAGKTTVAWLLGNCINNLLNKQKITKELYKLWVDKIVSYERVVFESDLDYIYFDSFQDTLLNVIWQLTGIPYSDMVDDHKKDNMVVNLKNFDYYPIEENIHPITAKELLNENMGKSIHPIEQDQWMLLRDFIIYFGHDVMKRFFGENVWVKALLKSPVYENGFSRTEWVIFVDTKTRAEQQYILDHGILINVVRNGNHKVDSEITNQNNDILEHCEYEIVITDDLMDTYKVIPGIAADILKKFNK